MSLPSDRSGSNPREVKPQTALRGISQRVGGAPEEQSLRDVIRVLRKRGRVILVSTIVALVLAILYCATTKNQYTATATLFVDSSGATGVDLSGLAGVASGMNGGSDLKTDMQTHAQVLQCDTTTLMVIEKLNLDKVYKYKPGMSGWNPKIKAELGLPLEQATATRERLLGIVEGKLQVVPQTDTRLIAVAYRDHDPQRAADVANAYVDLYIQKYLQDHFQATARASDWLNGQLDALKAQVAESQQKLSDYESKTGLSVAMLGINLGANGSAGASGGSMRVPDVDKLSDLNSTLTMSEENLIAKQAIYQLTQTKSPDVVLGLGGSSLVSLGGSSAIGSGGQELAPLQALRSQQIALQVQYADALTKYGAKNPHIVELQQQMATLQQAMGEELKRINERAKNDVLLAQKNMDGIRKSYQQQQEVVNKLNNSTIQLEELAGQAMSSHQLYSELYTRLQEANIQAGVSATNLRLVDAARPTTVPSRPKWLPTIGIAVGIGLVCGIGLVFVQENLDDSLVTTEQVERVGLLPVLSYVPLVRPEESQPGGPPAAAMEQSVLLTRPTAPAAEAYRALRTAILLSSADEPARVLLMTSPLSGDGKTTVSYNLAVAFAQHGRRVLLMDADMRKPRMHTLFHVRKSPGLSDVLTGGADLSSTIFAHPALETLSLIPSGTTPPNPAELLDSRRFDALLEDVKSRYDLIIIDSPPVLMVTDPVVLSSKVDGVIVAVRSRKTTRPVLRRAVEALANTRGRKLGFVVNGMDTKSVEYYYSYGYYGDNKYYGEEA